jgi:hypothetical protein
MSFSDEKVQKVWEKGHPDSNNDPNVWRKDDCTAWMKRSLHGNRESEYGWEIDHIDPDKGDDLSNLRPLQWKNNLDKADKKRLLCNVKSDGVHNTGL